jgi:hypothetical protein
MLFDESDNVALIFNLSIRLRELAVKSIRDKEIDLKRNFLQLSHSLPFHQISIDGSLGSFQHGLDEDSVNVGHEFVFRGGPE